MNPTDEQQDVIGAFMAERAIAVQAGAGTGKTTTIRLCGESTTRRGAYVAFNRSIVEEAKRKMPRNVSASTAHSIAFRQTGRLYAHRLDSPRMRSHEMARLLSVDPFTIRYGTQAKVLQPGFLAGHVMRAIMSFCQSDRPRPSVERDLAYIDGIDLPDANGFRTYENNDALRAHLVRPLELAWADLCAQDGRLPFKHDHYLKMWQLDEPRIPGDFVLFDEAQDAAPVMLAAVKRQAERGAQLVFVGDSQQQIYEWRGAVNALDEVPADDHLMLTQSFRFGPAIADVANACLEALDAPLRLRGTPSIASRVGSLDDPRAVLCRTNATAVHTMLRNLARDRRPHLIGGGSEVVAFCRAAIDLKAGRSTMYPDLACFTGWGEVQDYVANDPQGGELKLLVDLVDEHTPEVILGALQHMPAEGRADVVISTAHKAKGREWSTVQVADDFPDPDKRDASDGEIRLAYVTCTRAIDRLDVDMCEMVKRMIEPDEQPAMVVTP